MLTKKKKKAVQELILRIGNMLIKSQALASYDTLGI